MKEMEKVVKRIIEMEKEELDGKIDIKYRRLFKKIKKFYKDYKGNKYKHPHFYFFGLTSILNEIYKADFMHFDFLELDDSDIVLCEFLKSVENGLISTRKWKFWKNLETLDQNDCDDFGEPELYKIFDFIDDDKKWILKEIMENDVFYIKGYLIKELVENMENIREKVLTELVKDGREWMEDEVDCIVEMSPDCNRKEEMEKIVNREIKRETEIIDAIIGIIDSLQYYEVAYTY